MTLLAIAEQIETALSHQADEVSSNKNNSKVTLHAKVGKQTFVVTIAEMAKDHDEPSIS